MKNRLSQFLLLTMVILLASCATHRRNDDVLKQKNIVAQGSLSVKTQGLDASAPAKITIDQGKLVRLQVFIPLLGSELVRADFTPDEILFLDRRNKRYIKENYATANKLAGIDLSFSLVQKIVLDYLAVQDELRLSLPANDKPQELVLKGEFNSIKAADAAAEPTEISAKYKRMQITDIAKLLKQ